MTANTQATPTQHLVAGTLGGLVSTAALYPLELIKTRMQVIEVSKVATPNYSIMGSLRSVIMKEGFRGLYQGVTPAMIASAGSWGGYFYFYEQAKMRKLRNSDQAQLQTIDHLTSGIEAGAILVLLFNPLWLVKTRLALQGVEATASHSKYTGMIHALRTIVREEGPAGLYKGVVPALFLTSHGAIQFAVYEWLKTAAQGEKHQQGKQPAWVSVIIGGTAKIVASTVTYPYQVIKSRLQQRSNQSTSSASKYKGMLDCVLKIWRNEGATGYFRGVVPNALKVAPSAALTFVVYEEVLKLKLNV